MINQEKITIEWLSEVSKKHRNVDKILTEKTIRALLLLEGLAKQNIDFVFKGLCSATHKPLKTTFSTFGFCAIRCNARVSQ